MTEAPDRIITIQEMTAHTGRSCGTCYQCCITLGIEALHKYPGQACKHLSGANPTARCSIYPDRPSACSKYACAWLLGMSIPEDRPDQSGVVVTLYDPKQNQYRSQQTPFNATVHVVNPSKAGRLEDNKGPLYRIVCHLVEVGCKDLKILFGNTKSGTPLYHLLDGVIRKGKVIRDPHTDNPFEDLSFMTFDPPIGQFAVLTVQD